MTFDDTEICTVCRGSGIDPSPNETLNRALGRYCPFCRGTGRVPSTSHETKEDYDEDDAYDMWEATHPEEARESIIRNYGIEVENSSFPGTPYTGSKYWGCPAGYDFDNPKSYTPTAEHPLFSIAGCPGDWEDWKITEGRIDVPSKEEKSDDFYVENWGTLFERSSKNGWIIVYWFINHVGIPPTTPQEYQVVVWGLDGDMESLLYPSSYNWD